MVKLFNGWSFCNSPLNSQLTGETLTISSNAKITTFRSLDGSVKACRLFNSLVNDAVVIPDKSEFHPFIHFLYLLFPIFGRRGLLKPGYTLDRSPAYRRANLNCKHSKHILSIFKTTQC